MSNPFSSGVATPRAHEGGRASHGSPAVGDEAGCRCHQGQAGPGCLDHRVPQRLGERRVMIRPFFVRFWPSRRMSFAVLCGSVSPQRHSTPCSPCVVRSFGRSAMGRRSCTAMRRLTRKSERWCMHLSCTCPSDADALQNRRLTILRARLSFAPLPPASACIA